VQPGTYVGTTSQGERIQFDVIDGGRSISQVQSGVKALCGDGSVLSGGVRIAQPIAIVGNSFSSTFREQNPGGQAGTIDGTFEGLFSSSNAAAGTLRARLELTNPSRSCDSGSVSWNANWGGY
jgi:hypothetical protein